MNYYIRTDIDATLIKGVISVRPSIPISQVKLRDLTFIESIIAMSLDDLDALLSKVHSSTDLLIKLCKCFRSSIYKREAAIHLLRAWYVDSNTNEYAAETISKDFENIIEVHYANEHTRITNEWFFTLIEYLNLEDANEYCKRFVSDALVIDKRNDIHDSDERNSYNGFANRSYDFKDIHKCISDMRSFLALDRGDDGEHEWTHIRFYRNERSYIRNYSGINKKHMSDFKRDLSNICPFKMNKNITAFDIYSQWKEYFKYE